MRLATLTLTAAGLLALAPLTAATAQDKPERLTILSHAVHESVSTGSQGGDITAAWQEENGVDVEWVTLGTGPLHERLFRELELSSTGIDIAFLLNTRAVASVTSALAPMDPLQAANPIENIDDIFPGLLEAMTFDGTMYGVPFRHASSCFHYNKRILEERGIEPPTTIEEFAAAARAATYEVDGGKVHGFIINGQGYANVVDLARAWDGDFVSLDYKVKTTEPGMMNAANMLRDFYEEGVLPKSWAAVANEEVNTWMQTGRAAMTVTSCGRNRLYNDPEKSQETGNIETVALPVSEEFQGTFDVAPAKVEFWTIVIPANSEHKELAWDLVKTMLSEDSTLMAALNGNGPVRASTYDKPEMQNKLTYAAEEKAVLLVGRVPLPPFENSARATDVFVEEIQAAVLGIKPVDEAMMEIDKRVTPLLPQ